MKTQTSPFSLQRLRRLRLNRGQSGFSLVEVTLAIGITAFSLVSVLGLMPVGIGVFRDTVKEASSKRIADTLIAEIRDTPWETLRGYSVGDGNVNWGNYKRKFDIQGDAVTGDNKWVFLVKADISSAGSEVNSSGYPHNAMRLPGNAIAGNGFSDPQKAEQHLRKVSIWVAYLPEGMESGERDQTNTWIFDSNSVASQRGDIRGYHFFLSNSGTKVASHECPMHKHTECPPVALKAGHYTVPHPPHHGR